MAAPHACVELLCAAQLAVTEQNTHLYYARTVARTLSKVQLARSLALAQRNSIPALGGHGAGLRTRSLPTLPVRQQTGKELPTRQPKSPTAPWSAVASHEQGANDASPPAAQRAQPLLPRAPWSDTRPSPSPLSDEIKHHLPLSHSSHRLPRQWRHPRTLRSLEQDARQVVRYRLPSARPELSPPSPYIAPPPTLSQALPHIAGASTGVGAGAGTRTRTASGVGSDGSSGVAYTARAGTDAGLNKAAVLNGTLGALPTEAELRRHLRSLQWFQALSNDDLATLLGRAVVHSVPRYATIIREGSVGGYYFYLLLSGSIRITSEEFGISFILDGASAAGGRRYFGEAALVTSVRREATVTALKECHLLSLTAADMEGLSVDVLEVRGAYAELTPAPLLLHYAQDEMHTPRHGA